MKRERTLQVVLVLVGLFYVGLIYPLCRDLWHSNWLRDNEVEPMFLSLFVSLGVFVLMAVRQPSSHRSLIAYVAWSSLFHASVMVIQDVEASNHGVHRDFMDVLIFSVIGGVLLVLMPATREAAVVR